MNVALELNSGLGLRSAALLVAAGGACLLWHEISQSATGKKRRALAVVRFCTILLLSFILLKPEWVTTMAHDSRPHVSILWDDTQSMQTQDVRDNLNPAAAPLKRTDWIQPQLEQRFWSKLEERYGVSVKAFSKVLNAPSPADGTDVHAALSDSMENVSNLRAILLMSDGDWNTGKSPVTAATKLGVRGIPVYSIGVGMETFLPDIELQSLSLPAYCLVNERVSASITLTNHLSHEVRTTVRLYADNNALGEKDVVIPQGGTITENIPFTPIVEGTLNVSADTPLLPGERNPLNNSKSTRMGVRRELLKVLVVESEPRWEFRYLRNALARDAGVEMHVVLYHPKLAMGEGPGYLNHFPAKSEDLQSYDVIFIGDVGLHPGLSQVTDRTDRGLSVENCRMIRSLVEEHASGLVLIPGPNGFQKTLAESELGSLFPVDADHSRAEGIKTPVEGRLELTLLGSNHWLTMLASDAKTNESVWRSLPGFQWHAAIHRARPGSEVLAVHDTERGPLGRVPLLVTRNSGNGKVLYMGTDSAWKWRRGVEDTYHYRFWGQVVRWMAHQRHLSQDDGVRLFYTPTNPKQGDTVTFSAAILDKLGAPVGKAKATLTLTAPDGSRDSVQLSPANSDWGVLSGKLQLLKGGTYQMELIADDAGRRLSASMDVSSPQIEKTGAPAKFGTLREIAAITGGRNGTTQDLDAILSAINLLPEQRETQARLRLWCQPFLGSLILLLLSALWAGRKFCGLS
jgi:uncharacterized membrane protein